MADSFVRNIVQQWKFFSFYLLQLYTDHEDFKHGKIKSYFYLIILRKYVSCRITYKWLKII